MKLSLSLLAMLFLLGSCTYQTTSGLQGSAGYKQKFAGRIDEGSTHIRSTYYTSWERTADGHYVFKQYYTPYDTLTDYISYSKPIRDPKYLDGPSKRWYDDGRLCWEHYYENGKEVGVWKEYSFEDGKLEEEAVYDSTTNRSFHTTYAGEGYKSSVFYKKKVVIKDDPLLESYKRDGPFQVFDEEGELIAEGEYKLGEMVSEKVYDEEAYSHGEYQEEVMPAFISADCEGLEKDALKTCSDRAMLVKIYRNIKYPLIARNAGQEGVTHTQFVVEPDGSISNIRVIRGISEPLALECIRVVKLLDNWRPGLQDGRAVRVQFNLPIKFKLE
jgi:TonB family protein